MRSFFFKKICLSAKHQLQITSFRIACEVTSGFVHIGNYEDERSSRTNGRGAWELNHRRHREARKVWAGAKAEEHGSSSTGDTGKHVRSGQGRRFRSVLPLVSSAHLDKPDGVKRKAMLE